MYALNQSVEWSFVLNDIEDGARNADSTPTVTLYRNGASDPASVNVTNPTSGRYLCTFTIPVGWSLGDDFFAVATAVVDGVTFLVEVGRGRIGAVATDASGNALATASSVSALQTIFTGITSLAQWLGLIAGKQVGNSTARTELRATGAGSGTFDEATDSLEAVRDNMAAAAAGVTILPLSATMATDELRNYFLTCGQHAGKTWTLGVYDREENPVNLSGKTVKVAAWRSSSPSTIVVSMIGTVGGVNNNQVAFSITGANTTLAEVYQYRMRNTTDDTDLLEGTITIAPAPDIT